ncbi:killer cell lectin-like receptor 5 [Ailuropoda melanoleuca]|uniref:killer cell lectin-like receptor 5 n=1 Tax=Ailuropoda melanoleuca TaxID=9646 RepID=UPI00149497B1|nr:killer cell lectin-like receptor 5 [Ailuropoda melanoleuca]
MDSKLVKIEDEKELSFLQSQVSYYTWIGLSGKGISSSWTWEDNSPPFLKIGKAAWYTGWLKTKQKLTPCNTTPTMYATFLGTPGCPKTKERTCSSLIRTQ